MGVESLDTLHPCILLTLNGLHGTGVECRAFLSPKVDGFSFILIEPQRGDDGVAGFVWGLVHKEKGTDMASKTKS